MDSVVTNFYKSSGIIQPGWWFRPTALQPLRMNRYATKDKILARKLCQIQIIKCFYTNLTVYLDRSIVYHLDYYFKSQ